MILFDSKTDYFVETIDFEITSWLTQNGMSRNQYQGVRSETSAKVKFDITHLNWLNNWIKDTQGTDGRIRYAQYYKRDIYVLSNKGEFRFINSIPLSSEITGNLVELNFLCDYHETGGNFPELKQIYRDKKIDQILD